MARHDRLDSRNSFSWRPSNQDAGSSTMKVQVRGGNNMVAEDAEATVSCTITAASGGSGSLPVISSPHALPRITPASGPGDRADLHSNGRRRQRAALQVLHQPPGASYWKDLTGWQSQNWTVWKPTLADSGTNGLKVLVIDAKHAEKGGYDAAATISYTIAP